MIKSKSKQVRIESGSTQPRAKHFRAQHARRVALVWWDEPPSHKTPFGLLVQLSPKEKPIGRLRGGSALPAWLSRTEAKRLRDALDRALEGYAR